MKLKHLFAGALGLGLASSSVFAQTTEITITGATAFRQATVRAIYNAYNSVPGGLGTSFNVAHDFTGNNLSQLIASNKAVFSGQFPGITGTTVIRTAFNGSTEGLNAIAGNNNPAFLTTGALGTTGTIEGGKSGPTENLRPKFSFSDVFQSTSPVDNEVLEPVGASAVGVVTFAMVANDGAPSNWTNVTIQQCRALWQAGFLPLSIFTGDPADTTLVFATGRNDGSGTRSAYLTEWLYGAANLVKQVVATANGVNASAPYNVPATEIQKLTLVPLGGTGTGELATSGGASNNSTLWLNNAVGNGGYSSSSALRDHMGRTTANVTVYDGISTDEPIVEDAPIHLLTWLSTADSRNAAAANAKILAFNGVQVTPLASSTDPSNYLSSGFNQADFEKIATGAYSAWSYQHLYHHGSLSTVEQFWRDEMTKPDGYLEVGLQQTANGLRLSDMAVERADDGFPIFSL